MLQNILSKSTATGYNSFLIKTKQLEVVAQVNSLIALGEKVIEEDYGITIVEHSNGFTEFTVNGLKYED